MYSLVMPRFDAFQVPYVDHISNAFGSTSGIIRTSKVIITSGVIRTSGGISGPFHQLYKNPSSQASIPTLCNDSLPTL